MKSLLSMKSDAYEIFVNFPNFLRPYRKVAFTLIYVLIVYIFLVNKVIYKWPYLYIKS